MAETSRWVDIGFYRCGTERLLAALCFRTGMRIMSWARVRANFAPEEVIQSGISDRRCREKDLGAEQISETAIWRLSLVFTVKNGWNLAIIRAYFP